MVDMFSSEEDVQDFGALLDNFYEFDEPSRGDIRDAEILEIRKNEIVVDLGAKRDGLIPPQDIERMPRDLRRSLKEGDVVPVYVLNPSDRDGNLLVSLNLGLQGQDWEQAHKLLESGDVVECKVTGHNKGGLLVRFGRLEGFVPSSHLVEMEQGLTGVDRRDAMDAMIGQTITAKVIEVNQGRRRLILSQREAKREWRAQQKVRLLDELEVGDIIKGRVTGIRDFGVFVNLGGADGLIHVSELAWHRVPHPSDVVSIGEEIDVYILELDHDNQRIALSLCRTMPDPWDIVTETYNINDIVMGKVSNVVDFGAFVVLSDGIEGLLHVTEMADGTLTEPYSYLQRGDKVIMQVVRIEPERKRIGFTQSGLNLEKLAAEFEQRGDDAIIKPEAGKEQTEEIEVAEHPSTPDMTFPDNDASQNAA
jgi:small subunit ribosomal protein S1